jgi:histidine triad (HIT) family protein
VINITDCLFCKIINGTIPSSKVYEDNNVFCFLDITPVNKGHIIIIPKNHSTDFLEMSEEDITNCFSVAKKMGEKLISNLGADGFNTFINTKPASGQTIFHSHIHVLPRFKGDGLKFWSGKPYNEGEAEEVLNKLNN